MAELDSTGYKRKGYIYAGGTQIAQQDISNPGYGSQVTWETTSPATGSVYLSDTGHSVVRKELDPLGNDVTTAPDPAPVEPSFYNPKWDQMPLQYEGGPSADGGVPDWYVHMVNAQWDMHLAQGYWQSGHRDLAAEIVANNPNVGVQYNITGFGQEPMSGSIFGAQAGAFLNALGSLIDSGQLLQTGGPGFADRRELAHAASKGKRVALSDGTADLFKWARKSLLFELDDADSECSKFLKKTFGFSGSRVAKAVRGIRAWDGTSSTITTGAAGLEPYHLKDGTINGYASLTVSDYFLYWSQHGEPLGAAQAGYKRSTQRDVYFSRFFSGTDILHEALHMFSGGDDDALADKLHVDIKSGGSAAISLALNEGGCGK